LADQLQMKLQTINLSSIIFETRLGTKS